jgi:S1-C subfamily serine protease
MKRKLVVVTALAALLALVISGTVGAQSTEQTGYLGIGVQAAENGVLVGEVQPGSPADDAGVLPGDVISAINGSAVTAENIRKVLAGFNVGDAVALTVTRGDETLDLSATLAARPDVVFQGPQIPFGFGLAQRQLLGVTLENADAGARIIEVAAGSAAEAAGLQVDDIITSINGTTVQQPRDVVRAVREAALGDSMEIAVLRDGETITVTATLDTQPATFNFELSGQDVGIRYADGRWEITRLSEDSPLYTAGLREGDFITQINGEATNPRGLLEALLALRQENATEVTLTVERGGEAQEIVVPLDALQAFSFNFDLGGALPFFPNGELPIGPDGEMFVFPDGMMPGMPFNFDGEMPFEMGQMFQGAGLGVQYVTLNAEEAQERGIEQTEGAYVIDLLPESPAAQAGLQVNDIITAVNGDVLDAERTLPDRLAAYEPGDVVTLDVLRGGETLQIAVTLESFAMPIPGGMQFHFFGPDSEVQPDAPAETSVSL